MNKLYLTLTSALLHVHAIGEDGLMGRTAPSAVPVPETVNDILADRQAHPEHYPATSHQVTPQSETAPLEWLNHIAPSVVQGQALPTLPLAPSPVPSIQVNPITPALEAGVPGWLAPAIHGVTNSPEFLAHLVNTLEDLVAGRITEEQARADVETVALDAGILYVEQQLRAHAPALVAGLVSTALDMQIVRTLLRRGMDLALTPVLHTLLTTAQSLRALLGSVEARLNGAQ